MKIFTTFIFLLFCSGCGNTDEPAASLETDINSKPATTPEADTNSENNPIDSIKALGGKIVRDDMGNVIEVDFFNIWLSDARLVHLKGLTSLTTLNLQKTNITDTGLIQLQGLTNLTTLNLSDNNITDEYSNSIARKQPK